MPEEYLTTIEEGIRSAERDRQRTPTRVPTDEAIGDPDEGSPHARPRSATNGGTTMTDQRDPGSAELDRDRDADEDPGAYIGRMPERDAETIPGGITDKDERVAAHGTQSSPTARDVDPDGHREGPAVTDATIREAGQDR